MIIPRSVRRWLHLPGRVALILGLGALSTAGARADAPEGHGRAGVGDVLVRSEGGKIYLSQGGEQFQELRLGDTVEARHLRQLLEQNGAAASPAGLRLNPTILAGGGGSGFYWWTPAGKKGDPGKASNSDKAGADKKTGSPDRTNTAGKKG
jgi:hypothetical protein